MAEAGRSSIAPATARAVSGTTKIDLAEQRPDSTAGKRFIFPHLAFSTFILLLGACTVPPLAPEQRACLDRMENQAAALMPVFATLGYRFKVRLQLDQELADDRGFPKSEGTLADASPGGGIRLRPSRLCSNEVLARAVMAHEMAHVALQHRSVPGTGLVLLWEKPPQEVAANELAYAVLNRVGGDKRAAMAVGCWLGKCDEMVSPRAGRRC